MRRTRIAAVMLAGGLALGHVTCSISELPTDQVCKEAGYSIANRTLVCTGDAELANDRYERFDSEFSCTFNKARADTLEADFACAVNLRKLPCEKVIEYGDALGQWLYDTQGCSEILTGPDGGIGPTPPDCEAPNVLCATEAGPYCTAVENDVMNCGACGNMCPMDSDGEEEPYHHLPACVGGKCTTKCLWEFLDCDDDPNTCESYWQAPASCGSCDHDCTAGIAPNVDPRCTGGVCDYGRCVYGFGDCDGSTQNGCEADLLTDGQHCGACNTPCATTCTQGGCQ